MCKSKQQGTEQQDGADKADNRTETPVGIKHGSKNDAELDSIKREKSKKKK